MAMMHPNFNDAIKQVRSDLTDSEQIGVPSTIVSNAHLREILPVAESMAKVMNATENPFKDLIFHPERWQVVFYGIKDYPPRPIEAACFLADCIVVITKDDGRGRESLWFNADGTHVKNLKLESVVCPLS